MDISENDSMRRDSECILRSGEEVEEEAEQGPVRAQAEEDSDGKEAG